MGSDAMNNTPVMESGLKLWVTDASGAMFGSGVVRLLEHIDEAGTVRNAAANMGISYTKANQSIPLIEKKLGYKLLARKLGGVGGGGTTITETARELIHRYKMLCFDCHPIADAAFARYFKDYKPLPSSGRKGKYESDGISVSFKTSVSEVSVRGLHPGMKPWVSIDGTIFGMGLAELFENIIKTGNIMAASHEMDMSFSKAYVLIRSTKESLGYELVHTVNGGVFENRGAYVTESGFDIYQRYKAYVAECREWVCESFLYRFKDFVPVNELVNAGNENAAEMKRKLLVELQKYLLAHGTISPGMAFYAREQAITISEKEHIVDLVFCNTISQCFFLIGVVDGNPDVRKSRQVERYAKHFDENVKFSGDNPTIGLTIYVNGNGATAEYSMPNGSIRLFNEKYKKVFPAIEAINRKLMVWHTLIKNENVFYDV